MKRVVAIAAVFLFSSVAVPVTTATQQKVLLARKAKVGDVTRMVTDSQATVTMGGLQGSIGEKETTKSTVTQVAADGKLTVRHETESDVTTFNGQPAPPEPPNPPDTAVLSADRSLIAYRAGTGDPSESAESVRMYNATTVMFSPATVGVGESWTRQFKADVPKGSRPATAEYKLVALEKIGSIEAAKVSLSFQETAQDGMKVTGVVWVETATGDDIKAEFEVKNLLVEGIGLVNVTVRQTRPSLSVSAGADRPRPDRQPEAIVRRPVRDRQR